MQIIVLGAGAIGSVYGARLSKFHDVTLIGGAAHVEAIQRDGLVMQGIVPETLRLPAFTSVQSIAPGTLILLTTKVNNNAAAVEPIVGMLPRDVTIVCVQNGLYSENIVKDLVGDSALVLRAITQVGGVLVKPGVVDNTVAGYTLLESHPQSPAIAAILTEAGLDGRIIPDIKKEMWRKAVFNCVIPWSLVAWASRTIDAGLATILNSLSPIFIFLITWGISRHEPATARKFTGVMLGLAGVVAIIGMHALAGLGGHTVAEMACVAGSLSYAIAGVIGRRYDRLPSLVPAAGAALMGAAILVPIALVVEGWPAGASARSMLAVAGLAVFSTGAAFVVYFRLLATIGSIATASQAYLRILVGVGLSVAFLGETPTAAMVIGMALVVAGVVAMTLPPRRI